MKLRGLLYFFDGGYIRYDFNKIGWMTMKKVKFYHWTWCPFCIRAKELLMEKNISFEEINIDGDQRTMDRLTTISGSDTVPQVFVDEVYIGGCDELIELEKNGKLEEVFT